MYGSVLVTASLLDSMDFAVSCPPTWKDRAIKDFIGKIRREKVTYPEWVDAGEAFEDTVYRVCTHAPSVEEAEAKGSANFAKVAKLCYGGSFQNKLQKNLKIGDTKCFFFGYTDVDFRQLTIDIKTCLEWKGPNKYLNKSQHKLYLWMNNKPAFKYTVVEWADETYTTIQSVNIIDYISPGSADLEQYIISKTEELHEFIRSMDLWEDYFYTFSKN